MDLQTITEWARLTWPASSHNFYHDDESGIDTMARIRFDIAPADFDEFVHSLGFKRALYPNYLPFPREVNAPSWWIRQPAAKALGGSILSEGLGREVYVDCHPDHYTVYLRTFEV